MLSQRQADRIEGKNSVAIIYSPEEISKFESLVEVGGYEREIQELMKSAVSIIDPEHWQQTYGREPERGILISGPPGVGKSLLARAIVKEIYQRLNEDKKINNNQVGEEKKFSNIEKGSKDFFVAYVKARELVSPVSGSTEQNIRALFDQAAKSPKSIIILDEVDAIAPAREYANPGDANATSQILSCLDLYLKNNPGMMVIATTNFPKKLDEALRRPGRLGKDIELTTPSKNERREIFAIHTRGMNLDKDVSLEDLAERTAGYVGADIAGVTRKVIETAEERNQTWSKREELKKKYGEKFKESKEYKQLKENSKVNMKDFDKVLSEYKPTLFKKFKIEIPDVKFEDVCGLEEIVNDLKVWSFSRLKYQEAYSMSGLSDELSSYVLLAGPSGCGKTFLARAVARESEANFISVKGPEILNMFVGESEKAIREIFERARQGRNSIIFLDEVDAIAPREGSIRSVSGVTDSVLKQLLTELDGIQENKNILVIAATRAPDMLDPQFLNRFEKKFYVGPPDEDARLKIIKANLGLDEIERHKKNKPMNIAPEVKPEDLATVLEGYVPREIVQIIKKAKETMMKRIIEKKMNGKDVSDEALTLRDIYEAMNSTPKSFNEEEKAYWEAMAQEFKFENYKPGGEKKCHKSR
ncbi:MAG: AAA family ATPase [Candidatus Parvarchaeota archaeon]|nr:AAA family ATPase [Candidatus Jingweiarchaeum tengchongense]MCW1300051.1 AAA family ATPase [Candidatus Jingweiarchaeum tengchongense]